MMAKIIVKSANMIHIESQVKAFFFSFISLLNGFLIHIHHHHQQHQLSMDYFHIVAVVRQVCYSLHSKQLTYRCSQQQKKYHMWF